MDSDCILLTEGTVERAVPQDEPFALECARFALEITDRVNRAAADAFNSDL